MNIAVNKPIKRSVKLITVLIATIGLFFVTFSATQAYVAKYKQFKITSGYNTLTNSFSYNTKYGAGSMSKKDYVYKKGSTVTLEAVITDHKVTKGKPYYHTAFAEKKSGGGTVYWSFGERMIKNGDRKVWRPFIKKPMSSTVYFHDSNVAGSSTQYRVVTIFEY
ncbi:hypothetical protein [Rossellomorea marisflavi]|uniref:hypothetical protein n=1 Tax=Rossellomorea marisflavi TaxID=189381 RepID=UPI0011E6DBC6|nr:hypothetical protein [Rossellomorea marisflavi]TYO68603.1 hypothetical protein DQ398_003769 [Rossellomorea marisflavi]